RYVRAAAGDALLVVHETACALYRPSTPAATTAPVDVQASPEEARADDDEEDNRLDRVLTKIEIEKTPEQVPQTAPAVPVQEPKPVVEKTPMPEPRPAPEAPVQQPKETVKAPIETTRPQDKPATPAAPAPVV